MFSFGSHEYRWKQAFMNNMKGVIQVILGNNPYTVL